MSSDTREVADFSFLNAIKSPAVTKEPEPKTWPDRSPQASVVVKEQSRQISVRAPISVIDRLQRICKAERYSYGEMLERMLDAYEGRGR